MVQAELHSKLPEQKRQAEDVLTAYVFGYLECAPRHLLRAYLASPETRLGTTQAECEAAAFTW